MTILCRVLDRAVSCGVATVLVVCAGACGELKQKSGPRREAVAPGATETSGASAELEVVAGEARSAAGQSFRSVFANFGERVWVGPEYWANRLQDWRLRQGRAECVAGELPYRTLHLLTHRTGRNTRAWKLSVETGPVGLELASESATGFLVGAGAADLDPRAAALVHHSWGPEGGLMALSDATGRVFFQDFTAQPSRRESPRAGSARQARFRLQLEAVETAQGTLDLSLFAFSPQGRELSRAYRRGVPRERLIGNFALVSHGKPSGNTGRGKPGFWFREWSVSGVGLDVNAERTAGPIFSVQYTHSLGTLSLTAQLMPLARWDNQRVWLERKAVGGGYERIAEARVAVPGWTASFRQNNWDATRDTPYRVVYTMKQPGGGRNHIYEGTVRRDPVDQDVITVAAFTGTRHTVQGVQRRRFPWSRNGLWFPHGDIVRAVRHHRPDLLFFSGDQIYEGNNPSPVDRGKETMYYDYLYKWYLWGWAFRDLTRDTQTVTIPDDHDVYQGNLWGENGRAIDKDDKGGYVMPADWVKMVERTQTSNLPPPFDPTPIEQGIGVYYTSLNVGRIDFAILEDRKFKTGCSGRVPPTQSGRADHVIDPSFDPKTADLPGLKLLGDRQLVFVDGWASAWESWQGVDMKVSLMQSVLAGAATHHGPSLKYLVADYDSNGWPQSGRRRALRRLRRGFTFMIGGDQHLAHILHHGIDTWNDAGYSFNVPSIANAYLRAWKPRGAPQKSPAGAEPYTGRYLDGLGNHITVHAHTNPRPMGRQPAALHDGMPGYGIVKFNKRTRSIEMQCWPRFADPRQPKAPQYRGWPKTIQQQDNDGRAAKAYLPTLKVVGLDNPVVQIVRESDAEVLYTLRIRGQSFRPKVFATRGRYTVKVGEPGTEKLQTFVGVRPARSGRRELRVTF